MTFLLDTHIIVWWFEQNPRLLPAQKKTLATADAKSPLVISDISLWEISTLISLGRLKLRLPLRDWLERAVAPPLVRRIGISPAIAAEVASLPDSFHRDPADRILVATSRVLGATLLTLDKRIIDSGLTPTL
ncbi:MAG: type II toxin-antitoxin system VapC family toxin [Thermoanaerobaculales bacterium]|nr:type II toxin-antitoxin system VapC family toxin [Thermoanaerobaculales bacterium]